VKAAAKEPASLKLYIRVSEQLLHLPPSTRSATVWSMRSKLYVETSVISYLTARPSRDVISLGHQQLTREWWERAIAEFDLYASRLVVAEAQLGDPQAAAARLAVLEPITLLAETVESRSLAQNLLAAGGLPKKAASDALHIAVAAVHGMDYLVTWNCKHIANARMLRFVAETCRSAGFEPPVICTPEELAEE
jgi:predicted nucleic acid-binding protein